MSATVNVRCPVCEGQGLPISDTGPVHKCDSCSVFFKNPRPSMGKLIKERDKGFGGAFTADYAAIRRSDAEAAIQAMRGYHLLVSGKDAPLNAFDKRVLDIGCGLGFKLREFEKYGWSASGIEPSENARGYMHATMLHVTDYGLREKPFDLILVEDVIEEVDKPKNLVAFIKESLSPQGVLYVAVSLREGGEPKSIPKNKIYLFNETSLRKLFMQAGFAEPHVKTESKLRLWFKHKRK